MIPMTSQPIPTPRPTQLDKPHSLAVSLPSTTTLHTDDFQLTSLDPEPGVKPKSNEEQRKKSTLDYVQKAALQLYHQNKMPWQRYMKHLKQKQKKKKPPVQQEPANKWVTDLSDITTHL